MRISVREWERVKVLLRVEYKSVKPFEVWTAMTQAEKDRYLERARKAAA